MKDMRASFFLLYDRNNRSNSGSSNSRRGRSSRRDSSKSISVSHNYCNFSYYVTAMSWEVVLLQLSPMRL